MENGSKMFKPKELSELLGVSKECLRNWSLEGKIKFTTTEGGHRRYIYEFVEEDKKQSIIYTRVSSSKQKNDLKRQSAYLKEHFPDHELITDIGSGLNFKRKGLLRILELLFSGNIKEVVVAHRDRLCRFGFELFEFIFKKHGAILTVFENEGIKAPINEFAEDVLSIITVFTARYYGSRKYNLLQENKDLSNERTGFPFQQMLGSEQVFLQQSKPLYKNKISRISKQRKYRKRKINQ